MKEYMCFMPTWYKVINFILAGCIVIFPFIFGTKENGVYMMTAIILYTIGVCLIDGLENVGINNKNLAGQIDFIKCSQGGRIFMRRAYLTDTLIKMIPVFIAALIFGLTGGTSVQIGNYTVFKFGIWSVLSVASTLSFGIGLIVFINRFSPTILLTAVFLYFELIVISVLAALSTMIPPVTIVLAVGMAIMCLYRNRKILEDSYHDKEVID